VRLCGYSFSSGEAPPAPLGGPSDRPDLGVEEADHPVRTRDDRVALQAVDLFGRELLLDESAHRCARAAEHHQEVLPRLVDRPRGGDRASSGWLWHALVIRSRIGRPHGPQRALELRSPRPYSGLDRDVRRGQRPARARIVPAIASHTGTGARVARARAVATARGPSDRAGRG
jgi:hypothetical protein